jgi:hypothetical protein
MTDSITNSKTPLRHLAAWCPWCVFVTEQSEFW